MNKYLLITLKTIFYIIIVWFIGYFIFGENISIEFTDYQFARKFPNVLTFATGSSVYFLFLLNIKKNEGFNLGNGLKLFLGIIFGVLPFILFKYYSSVGNCQNWEVTKKVVKTHFISISSTSESIKSIETYCFEMNKTEQKTYRVMSLTPLFNTISEIDTTKIKPQNWKKYKD